MGALYRQGDLLLERVSRGKKGTVLPRDGGRIVLAHGEQTGHAHAISDEGAELVETDVGERFLRVLADGGVTLRHEEHGPITLPKGTYRVRRQREYEPSAIRAIPQRELRNDISRVLAEVGRGSRLRVTVGGRPMADLVPVSGRKAWVGWEEVERIRREAPLDAGFMSDVQDVVGDTIEEL